MMKGLCCRYGQLGVFIVCLFFAACIPEDIELPYRVKSVTTGEVISVTPDEAKLSGNVSVADADAVTCGIIYGTSSTLSSASGTKKSTQATDGYYFLEITGLNDNTTYHYRAYAVDAGRYKYGEIRSFTTKKSVTVTTGEAVDITTHSVNIKGTVNNAEKPLDCGIVYGTSSELSYNGGTVKSTTSSGEFSVSITGLNASILYYYCAYVVVNGVYRYGEVRSFRTKPEVTITTNAATNITDKSATLGGTINNSDKPLACGIIYGTSSSLSSSNGTVKSTTSSGTFSVSLTGLSSNTTYYYRAYVIVDGEYKYGEVSSFKTLQDVDVDLGLSVKWASCNVGAESPEEYGGYYAWGETEEKSNYSWSTYKWCNGNYDTMTKYCTNGSYGTVDNKTTLELSDDVAHVKWGASWRMPTLAEIRELINECTWEWTTQNGVSGYKVTGPNDNSIFLPAAGYRYGTEVYDRGSYGYYWSGTLDGDGSGIAYGLYFLSGRSDWYYGYRSSGHTVRPVTE